MVTVEVIIRDEEGEVLVRQIKGLELADWHFEQIERSVESWKQTTLPEIEGALLKKTGKTRDSQ